MLAVVLVMAEVVVPFCFGSCFSLICGEVVTCDSKDFRIVFINDILIQYMYGGYPYILISEFQIKLNCVISKYSIGFNDIS